MSPPIGSSLGAPGANRALLETVEPALTGALHLRRWWLETDLASRYRHRFALTRSFNRPTQGLGFFDTAPLATGPVPVMGVVQDMLFDRADHCGAQGIDRTSREFGEYILRYFMRVSDFRRPEAVARSGRQATSEWMRALGWCPRETPSRVGFGYSQHFYKRRRDGTTGTFPLSEQHAIVDLRDLERTYEWLVLKVRILDFNLVFRPFGPNLPAIVFPLEEETYLVISREFIRCRERPRPGVRAEYGFGYAVLRDVGQPGVLAYGPGRFDLGFQQIIFTVRTSGQIDVRLVFVVNRPTRIINLMIDPVRWGLALADLVTFGTASPLTNAVRQIAGPFVPTSPAIDPLLSYISLANLLTAGEAASRLCISKEQLEREMLLQHFMQHYDMIVGSLLTWRSIPDWLDPARLPQWAFTGESA